VKSGSKGNLNGEGETKDRGMLRRLFSPVFLEAFVLTFLAEWGDRSQVGLPMHPFCTQPTPDFSTAAANVVMLRSSAHSEHFWCTCHSCCTPPPFFLPYAAVTVLIHLSNLLLSSFLWASQQQNSCNNAPNHALNLATAMSIQHQCSCLQENCPTNISFCCADCHYRTGCVVGRCGCDAGGCAGWPPPGQLCGRAHHVTSGRALVHRVWRPCLLGGALLSVCISLCVCLLAIFVG
jgi:hypothetical protein